MRIVQITDVHIGTPEDRPFGIDVRAQFTQVLSEVSELNPDRLVLSGDLCYRDPLHEVYPWIAEQLRIVSCPVQVLAGNHDAQSIMQHYFKCEYHFQTDEIYCSAKWNNVPVFFLDTGRGVMSEQQYDWLTAELQAASERILIFMHHPPVYCGVPHMDMNYPFREIPRLQDILRSTQSEIQIFCGHYHVERKLSFANQHIHLTPSTFFQIDATEVEFKIDHKRAGYRVIDIVEGERVVSWCCYL